MPSSPKSSFVLRERVRSLVRVTLVRAVTGELVESGFMLFVLTNSHDRGFKINLKWHHALKALAIRGKKIHLVGSPELRIEGTPVYLDVEACPTAISTA